ncbi:hypothetical protein W97_04758 [Coniosporium apollinis CBS 100218]|uniref:Chitobiosyldiphosphodolichol beta-mannosyltransferase n=1 Tax=Coniosporium apollinis (strain CBS 100218) TaxID=1168221 RepID=R7YUE9_CONA1|nr:uncharacterized protein W97_04758 [Coniosporium apollinis CBS 100218]EON65520.1 hypothetical protein W97_04758 [Coniosporium apollinis CBS 100218]
MLAPLSHLYLGSAIISFLAALSTALTVFFITAPTQYDPYAEADAPPSKDGEEPRSANGKRRKVKTSVQVVVLGDIGRSPRMQYHALSIAKRGGKVDLIGYKESDVHPDIASNPLISVIPLAPVPEGLRAKSAPSFLLLAPLKVLWQTWTLYYALGYRTRPARWMLVQNPPAVPTLAVAAFLCFFRNTSLIIDWHNFGYSILALRLGAGHPLVKISQLYEGLLSRFAASHFAVTNAMARVLEEKHGITASPLHDRPTKDFQPLVSEERFEFLSRLPETAQYAEDIKQGQWKLVVSSTSWTPDENFSILLDALVGYSAKAVTKTNLPKLIAIITGKGPQKEHYLSKIKALNQEKKLLNVIVLTAWLSTEDYAKLLGSADLGISLHTSSSGVDLPMKVVDMFGAGLPVLGWSKYEAWPELVTEGVNGMGFGSAEELGGLLVKLLGEDRKNLQNLRDGALEESKRGWDEEWDAVAGKKLRLVA